MRAPVAPVRIAGHPPGSRPYGTLQEYTQHSGVELTHWLLQAAGAPLAQLAAGTQQALSTRWMASARKAAPQAGPLGGGGGGLPPPSFWPWTRWAQRANASARRAAPLAAIRAPQITDSNLHRVRLVDCRSLSGCTQSFCTTSSRNC
jgi:hypothetical protein